MSQIKCEVVRDSTLNILKAVVSLIYFVRQCLVILDKQAFLWSNEERTSSVGSLLHGRSNLGGPQGWVKKELISRCRDWIQGETTLGSDPRTCMGIETKMTKWIDSWVAQHPSNLLTFDNFAAYTKYITDVVFI